MAIITGIIIAYSAAAENVQFRADFHFEIKNLYIPK